MQLVSFYTPDYSKYATNLQIQCEMLGQSCLILPRNYGDWITSVRAKPEFLLEMSNYLKSDFIWLDVDSYLLKKIDFQLNYWGVLLRSDGTPHDFVHYVPYNSYNFLQLWIDTIERNKKGSHTAFIEIKKDYTVLPDGYFQIGISDNASKRAYFQVK